MKHENETGIAKEGAAQVEAVPIGMVKTSDLEGGVDALGVMMWPYPGPGVGTLEPVTMLYTAPPASPSEGGGEEPSNEEIVRLAKEHQWQLSEHYGATVFQFRLYGLIDFARSVLSLSPSRGEAVDAAESNPWADLWYFVMDEAPGEFERIVTELSPKRWHDEAHKLMREKYPLAAIQSQGAKP